MGKVVYVFIDASNLWAVQKTKGSLFDLAALKAYLKTQHAADTLRVYYYDAYPAEHTRERGNEGKFRFYVYLEKALQFVVRKKPLKQIKAQTDHGLIVTEKGNMDVEMSIDVVNQIDRYDEAVLFSGDSDFLALVRYVRNKGKKVYIYSSRNNVSTELRTGADGYTDILAIDAPIWRQRIERRNAN